jgi:U3 small nucleolar RNA-associated protein 12
MLHVFFECTRCCVGNSLQRLVEELTGKTAEAKKKPTALPVNPFLVGKTPDDHVLKALTSIRSTELEESLMVLPFEYVAKLLRFLDTFIEKAIETELCVKCLLFMVSTHQNQIISNQVMVGSLTSLRKNTRRRLRILKVIT